MTGSDDISPLSCTFLRVKEWLVRTRVQRDARGPCVSRPKEKHFTNSLHMNLSFVTV